MINPATSAQVPTPEAQSTRISNHAVQRYQERVGEVSASAAAGEIRHMLATGTCSSRPRSWTSCRVEPGMRFVYAAHRADICLVLRDRVVVTVLTTELRAGSSDRSYYAPAPMRLRGWQQRLEEEADIYEPLPDDLAWVA